MTHYKFDLSQTASNDAWLLSRRLLKDGSKESLEKFEKMENAEMIEHDKFEEEE